MDKENSDDNLFGDDDKPCDMDDNDNGFSFTASESNLLRNRKPTYSCIKASPFLAASNLQTLGTYVKLPNVIVMVGLPARGKTYISRKLCRYLKWIGIKTKVFNLGDYRRSLVGVYEGCQFFDPLNEQTKTVLEECARHAMEDVKHSLDKSECEVAIFDATNTTRSRRQMVSDFCGENRFRVLFVESVCNDPKVIEHNIQDVKVNSPDYKGMEVTKAKDDFLKRIQHYKTQYEPLDAEHDDELSYIKIINAGSTYYVHNIQGHVQSRVVYFLMNIHLMPRSIYLSRHGESEYNRMGRIGGDSPLSSRGLKYATELANYFSDEKVVDLRVWSSQKLRAVQTAKYVLSASHVEHWKALDEIDAGICEALTYEEIAERYPHQFQKRDSDKYHYRYPSGESYEDLVARLEPVIMELERQSNVLVVSHQAVLRCILAYFLDKDRNDLPYQKVPLHSVVKLTPIAYGCNMTTVNFDIDAVDTHRAKPAVLSVERSVDEALQTVPQLFSVK